MLSPAAVCHVVVRLDDVVRGAERATKGYPWLVAVSGVRDWRRVRSLWTPFRLLFGNGRGEEMGL